MDDQSKDSLMDIDEALKELHHIREMIDKGRMIHPIRKFIRPLMPLSILAAILIVIYGVIAQLLLDNEIDMLFGIAKQQFLWGFGCFVLVLIVLLKTIIPVFKYRKDEKELINALRKTYTTDYLRVVFPVISLIAASCVVSINTGNSHQVFGLITAGIGSIWTISPILFPYPELKPVGLIGIAMVIAGIASMFLFPSYVFYKLALIWGIGLFLLGILSLRISRRLHEG